MFRFELTKSRNYTVWHGCHHFRISQQYWTKMLWMTLLGSPIPSMSFCFQTTISWFRPCDQLVGVFALQFLVPLLKIRKSRCLRQDHLLMRKVDYETLQPRQPAARVLWMVVKLLSCRLLSQRLDMPRHGLPPNHRGKTAPQLLRGCGQRRIAAVALQVRGTNSYPFFGRKSRL